MNQPNPTGLGQTLGSSPLVKSTSSGGISSGEDSTSTSSSKPSTGTSGGGEDSSSAGAYVASSVDSRPYPDKVVGSTSKVADVRSETHVNTQTVSDIRRQRTEQQIASSQKAFSNMRLLPSEGREEAKKGPALDSPSLASSSTAPDLPKSPFRSKDNLLAPTSSPRHSLHAETSSGARKTAGSLRSGRTSKEIHASLYSESSDNSPKSQQKHLSSGEDSGNVSERDVWEPTSHADSVVSPPGALQELPSMSSASISMRSASVNAPWMRSAAHVRQKPSASYDWASFVYAYSRGKWDPTRLPQPPTQSNLFPGTVTSIGAKDSTLERPKSPEAPHVLETELVRRPSIDYSSAPGKINRILSEPDRKKFIQESRVSELSKPQEEGKDEVRGRENPARTSLGQEQDKAKIVQSGESSQSPHFTDPFSKRKASTANVDSQTGTAAALDDLSQTLTERSRILPSTNNPDQTTEVRPMDSQLDTRTGIQRFPSDPADQRRFTEKQRDTEPVAPTSHSDASSPAALSGNLSTATRPALAAQISTLSLNANHTSRGKDVRTEGLLDTTNDGSPRPDPAPFQSSTSAVSDPFPNLLLKHRQSRGSTSLAIDAGAKQDSSHAIRNKTTDVAATNSATNPTPSSGSPDPHSPFPSSAGSKPESPFDKAAKLTRKRAKSGSAQVSDSESKRSDAVADDKPRRTSAVFFPKMPVDLAQIGPSNSSPSLSTYVNLGKRIETFFKDNGYLPAIMPPDELERRQALRRYGPPKIRGDSNFERIGHLVKLVFNTKLVLITLVGENTQHLETEIGAQGLGYSVEWLRQAAAPRDCSMCAHSILQPNDEPLVVVDTLKDWRFAGNPLVINMPKIRFYAGAPLRTSDGYNLGSLCIIDDKPWPEFSPRHRHTLREFARVVMREMELVRDTIHLRTQDRMQHSIESFTRECIEMESDDNDEDEKDHSQGLHQVYALAAKSMCEALQATGAIVFDLSQFEMLMPNQDNLNDDGKIFFPSPYQFPEAASAIDDATKEAARTGYMPSSNEAPSQAQMLPPMPVLGSCESTALPTGRNQKVPLSHHMKIAEFLRKHRKGFFYPFTPATFKHLLPVGMSNVLLVPIFGLNRQPFALLCAYSRQTDDISGLEDIKDLGLRYLRAMGTIILSAVLKKDIMLADKAKSHFISNISHELRTPLHGILAAAELLAETKLSTTQNSYLETVEACGKSLLELVNHVLDFTKLSGDYHAKQVVQKASQKCDLVKLVQEVCESSWIGQMAKNLDSSQHAGIGSMYAKGSESASSRSSPEGQESSLVKGAKSMVETVIDVSMRSSGWLVNCDAGGIRRVLMNLIGNSLKFTTQGFVHVSLREVQSSDTHVLVELGVTDTGKGISRSFLEEQLFHPFTQENHLGPGTGLGLSIVNSIVQSPAINGKIDVWSTVGQGTEIRVTCELELGDPSEAEGPTYCPVLNVEHQRSISLVGFDESQRGQVDLKDVLQSYFEDWWRFTIYDTVEKGDLVLVNENATMLYDIIGARSGVLPPVILLTSERGNPDFNRICEDYEKKGGVTRLLFKPAGPAKLEAVTDFCLQCFERGMAGLPLVGQDSTHSTPLPSPADREEGKSGYFVDTDPGMNDDGPTPKGPPMQPQRSGSLRSHGLRPPMRPRLSNELRRNSHHISPAPPSASDAALIRRHSSEDRAVLTEREDGSSGEKETITSPPESTSKSQAGGTAGESESAKPSKPLLPTRSITYHEPRLQRHVLMSPLRSPHYRRADGEAMDYFGPVTAGSHGAAPAGASSPTSPGSIISLDGGEGAVLRSAINTAGLVRGHPNAVAIPKKRLRILSVEDNSINRRVLAAFFGKMDVDLVEATNGEEGVKAFESYPPFHFDVIFMDLSMPVLDGIGAIMQIRKMEAERFRAEQSGPASWLKALRGASGLHGHSPHTSPSITSSLLLATPGGSRPSAQVRAKIFALTGRSSDEDKRKAFANGADGFIVKPLSFKVLNTLISKISVYQQ